MKTLLFISSILLITQSALALDISKEIAKENKLAMVCSLGFNYQEVCQVARLDVLDPNLGGGVGGNYTIEPFIINQGSFSLAQQELIDLALSQEFVDPVILSKATKVAFAGFMGGVGGN